VAGVAQGLGVDAVPGRAQRYAVIDPGALEDLPHGVGADALNFVSTGKVFMVRPHVERRKVIGLQDDLVVVRQVGIRDASQ
jgi:hypothetical protein